MQELTAKGLIKPVASHRAQIVYTRASKEEPAPVAAEKTDKKPVKGAQKGKEKPEKAEK